MDNSLSEVVGKNIRNLRERRGLAQKFVAEKIGVKNNTLSGYEAGRRLPDADILQKLADFYEVSVDFLIGRTDDPSPVEYDKDEFDDPSLGIWFKELKEAPKEKREELRRFWDFIKLQEQNRKPGDKQ